MRKKTKKEILEELTKLYKGREWRNENYWAVDMGIVIDGQLHTPKQMLIEFERAKERIETLEWVLGWEKTRGMPVKIQEFPKEV